jgi:gas vesicle protein
METVMPRKKMIMLGMVIGSIVGGYLPALFGFDGLMVSLFGSLIGGIIGIWMGYKFSM